MSEKLVKMLATFFYIGKFPVAPGSVASFVALLLCVIVYRFPVIYILLFLVVLAVGWQVSGRYEELVKGKDPTEVVIDEVAGIFIALFLLPLTIPVLVVAFFLFRAFDMFKIFPADILEKKRGSTGIMADDLVAGLYTNIVMQIAIRWAGIV